MPRSLPLDNNDKPDLPPSASPSLRALAARGELRRYRKGAVLIEEGQRGDTIFVIVEGRLRAYAGGDGGREVTYGVYGPGEYLGEMSLDGGPRSANVVALETSTCSVITRDTLLRHIAADPAFALELIGKLIRRARAATLSTRQLALNDVYGRLRLLFDELAVGVDGARRIAPQPTHRDIAARLGCSREMVSRLMKDLERGGYVSAVDGAWLLHKPLPMRW